MSLEYRGLGDRVVVITGAGQGLGRAYAHHFARAGSRVVIAELNEERGAAVERELDGQSGRALFVATDVSDVGSCEAMVARVTEEFGALDVLINNAGILAGIKMKPFWEVTADEWDLMMAVNLRGVWAVTRAAVPALRRSQAPSVVNVSSGVVFLGRPNYAHYVASKAGVLGLSRAMARELGDVGVRVNCVTAGPIETEVPRETVSPEQREALIRQQCVKRAGRPEDLLGVMAFLASDDSAFISGQTFNVDGGLALH